MMPKMLTLGAYYTHPEVGHVRLLSAQENGPMCIVEAKPTRLRSSAKVSDLSGPTHMPCPFCGEIKPVSTTGLAIDLAEHMDRCQLNPRHANDGEIQYSDIPPHILTAVDHALRERKESN